MNGQVTIDWEALIREIARYLETVDVFRAEQCEPTWLPEPGLATSPTSARRGAEAGVATG